eukprot:g65344.t1
MLSLESGWFPKPSGQLTRMKVRRGRRSDLSAGTRERRSGPTLRQLLQAHAISVYLHNVAPSQNVKGVWGDGVFHMTGKPVYVKLDGVKKEVNVIECDNISLDVWKSEERFDLNCVAAAVSVKEVPNFKDTWNIVKMSNKEKCSACILYIATIRHGEAVCVKIIVSTTVPASCWYFFLFSLSFVFPASPRAHNALASLGFESILILPGEASFLFSFPYVFGRPVDFVEEVEQSYRASFSRASSFAYYPGAFIRSFCTFLWIQLASAEPLLVSSPVLQLLPPQDDGKLLSKGSKTRVGFSLPPGALFPADSDNVVMSKSANARQGSAAHSASLADHAALHAGGFGLEGFAESSSPSERMQLEASSGLTSISDLHHSPADELSDADLIRLLTASGSEKKTQHLVTGVPLDVGKEFQRLLTARSGMQLVQKKAAQQGGIRATTATSQTSKSTGAAVSAGSGSAGASRPVPFTVAAASSGTLVGAAAPSPMRSGVATLPLDLSDSELYVLPDDSPWPGKVVALPKAKEARGDEYDAAVHSLRAAHGRVEAWARGSFASRCAWSRRGVGSW